MHLLYPDAAECLHDSAFRMIKEGHSAEKGVALLVIDKIKKGEMPPTVTIQELAALEIIKISQ